MRKWLAEGLDLEADIVPELSRIAGRLTGPLGSLGRKFVIDEIRARRERRLAVAAVPRGPPDGQGRSAEASLRWTRPRSGANRNFELESLLEMAGNA